MAIQSAASEALSVPASTLSAVPFRVRLLAETLTLHRSSQDAGRLYQPLNQSVIDLNPHQIDAAIFAFNSPLSRGAILADEVGLGKTIEAGLVISQLVAEGQRHVLVLCPATLRAQWESELQEKFGLTATIIRNGTGLSQSGVHMPPGIYILSIPYAYRKVYELKRFSWDLVVIDESHRLRNPKGHHHVAFKDAFAKHPKLLLTATPLHNNLLELFALVSFVDQKVLGTEYSFKQKYIEDGRGLQIKNTEELKARLHTIITRTLRRQVQEYVRFTERKSIVQDFTPTPEEQELYQKVSAYLQRPQVAAIEHAQRTLMILVYRKLLASSSFAITHTLRQLAHRLEARLADQTPRNAELPGLEDTDAFQEEGEEWVEPSHANQDASGEESMASIFTVSQIEAEIQELHQYADLAERIKYNAKGEALLRVLAHIFAEAKRRNWPDKVVIFTESRRTQHYLKELLDQNGYQGQVTVFSGLSGDLEQRRGLLREFETQTRVFLSTEAGAEGINLQFANVVVNYDLPWNPQRIEQRIGRCHRYGQRYDVVVINFLNRANAADQRLYELLEKKLRLFNGLFGASDEILGALESGIDFERRVLEIYQSCRTEEEINTAFRKLQALLDEKIQATLVQTRARLLERFDDEVRERFRDRDASIRAQLTEVEQQLQELVLTRLGGRIEPEEPSLVYRLLELPPNLFTTAPFLAPNQHFCFARLQDTEKRQIVRLHLGHPFVQHLIERIKTAPPSLVCSRLLYTEGIHRISLIDPYKGRSGWWFLYRVTFEGLETEQRLISVVLVNEADTVVALPQEVASRFQRLTMQDQGPATPPTPHVRQCAEETFRAVLNELVQAFLSRNRDYYEAERDKLDLFMEENLMQLEDELRRLKAQWQEVRRKKERAETVEERIKLRDEMDRLEQEYRRQLTRLNEENLRQMDDKQRQLKELEARLQVRQGSVCVGICQWKLE